MTEKQQHQTFFKHCLHLFYHKIVEGETLWKFNKDQTKKTDKSKPNDEKKDDKKKTDVKKGSEKK